MCLCDRHLGQYCLYSDSSVFLPQWPLQFPRTTAPPGACSIWPRPLASWPAAQPRTMAGAATSVPGYSRASLDRSSTWPSGTSQTIPHPTTAAKVAATIAVNTSKSKTAMLSGTWSRAIRIRLTDTHIYRTVTWCGSPSPWIQPFLLSPASW